MGWMGAMAGFGQGFQGYAQLMNDNRKLQLSQQQDEIAHQRQIALENLKANNQMKAAQTQRGWNMEDAQTQRGWALEDFDKKADKELEHRKAIHSLDREQNLELNQQNFQNKLIELRAVAETSMDLQIRQREMLMRQQIEAAQEAGASPQELSMIKLSIIAPEAANILFTDSKLSLPDLIKASDSLIEGQLKFGEEWQTLGEKEQNKVAKELGYKTDEAGRAQAGIDFAFTRTIQGNPFLQQALSMTGGNSPSQTDTTKTSSRISEEDQTLIERYARGKLGGDEEAQAGEYLKGKFGPDGYNRIMAEANKRLGLDEQPLPKPKEDTGKGALSTVADKFNNFRLRYNDWDEFESWHKENKKYPLDSVSKAEIEREFMLWRNQHKKR